MFKRTILAAIAFSILAAPMAQAQSRYDGPRSGQHHHQQPAKPRFQAPPAKPAYKAPSKPGFHAPNRRHEAQRPAPKRHHWARGQRVPEWQRKQHVRDFYRHGLKRPARGQQWVKVDNDYLLISMATGLILGLAASR
jgi:Ni/Co efflux regulator RcnB